jgi:hypothetical protein
VRIGEVRDALGDAIRGVGRLNVYDRVADSINPPAAILGSPTGTFDSAFGRSAHDLVWPIWIVVAKAADGQLDDLDQYLADDGDTSIRDAIDTYSTDAYDDARVLGFEQYGVVTVGGVEYVGCVMNVSILV